MPAKAGIQELLTAFLCDNWVPDFAGTSGKPICPLADRFNFQTAKFQSGARRRPCSLRRGGAVTSPRRSGASPFSPGQARGDGAPSGAPVFRFAALSFEERGRLSALHRGFSVPGAVLPGADPGGFWLNPIRRAFARLRPRRVQPSKAAPRSWSGRLPGASRRREERTLAPAGAASPPARTTPHESALMRRRRCGL